jgi:hypothetical protein
MVFVIFIVSMIVGREIAFGCITCASNPDIAHAQFSYFHYFIYIYLYIYKTIHCTPSSLLQQKEISIYIPLYSEFIIYIFIYVYIHTYILLSIRVSSSYEGHGNKTLSFLGSVLNGDFDKV